MSKRDISLKEKLQALRVNEPLKLNKSGVGMKPPEKTEAPQKEVPPLQRPPTKAAQIEVPHSVQFSGLGKAGRPPSGPPRNALAHTEPPQNEIPKFKDTDPEAAQNEIPQNGSAPSQDEAPQTEYTQTEVVPTQGFFKLSHHVFMDPILRELSGDCFRLFLWMSSRAWRYPTSDGSLRASVGFIETHTGMSHATISRALKSLKDRQLISIVEVHFKKGNLWQVSGLASGYKGPENPPRKKGPQNEVAQIETEATLKRGHSTLKARQHPPQIEGDLRSIKKIKKLKEAQVSTCEAPASVPEPSVEFQLEALRAFEGGLEKQEQEAEVRNFALSQYPHGFFPPPKVLRRLVASRWYKLAQGVAHHTIVATA